MAPRFDSSSFIKMFTEYRWYKYFPSLATYLEITESLCVWHMNHQNFIDIAFDFSVCFAACRGISGYQSLSWAIEVWLVFDYYHNQKYNKHDS